MLCPKTKRAPERTIAFRAVYCNRPDRIGVRSCYVQNKDSVFHTSSEDEAEAKTSVSSCGTLEGICCLLLAVVLKCAPTALYLVLAGTRG